jgi:hypothetical protein
MQLPLLRELALEHQLQAQRWHHAQRVAAPVKALQPDVQGRLKLVLQAVEVDSKVLLLLGWLPGRCNLRVEGAWVQTWGLYQLHRCLQTPPPTAAPLHPVQKEVQVQWEVVLQKQWPVLQLEDRQLELQQQGRLM